MAWQKLTYKKALYLSRKANNSLKPYSKVSIPFSTAIDVSEDNEQQNDEVRYPESNVKRSGLRQIKTTMNRIKLSEECPEEIDSDNSVVLDEIEDNFPLKIRDESNQIEKDAEYDIDGSENEQDERSDISPMEALEEIYSSEKYS